ncbi:MAG TPA: hypothetical protein VFT43_13565, partial [Candidatus Polarisedimenticolia bacterium]|nr:hypothetical protein [Candidatus Polarisedimenticolia bacterium]
MHHPRHNAPFPRFTAAGAGPRLALTFGQAGASATADRSSDESWIKMMSGLEALWNGPPESRLAAAEQAYDWLRPLRG